MAKSVDKKTRERLAKLHAMLGSEGGERENAWRKIDEILKQHGKTWNDLLELLAWKQSTAHGAGHSASPTGPPCPLLIDDLIAKFTRHCDLPQHGYLVCAAWTAHTHIFARFMVTPRLLVTSAVPGEGKTTVLDLVAWLSRLGRRYDDVSPAFIRNYANSGEVTLVLDEMDNVNFYGNSALCAIYNSGHRVGGRSGRATSRGGMAEYSNLAPIALGMIGLQLRPPQLHRSIILRVERAGRAIDPLDLTGSDRGRATQKELQDLHDELVRWSAGVKLDTNPEMPTILRDKRLMDNWRPLFSLIDTCGGEWPKRIRDAAIALSAGHGHEDVRILLLLDVRRVFDRLGIDRIYSQALVEALVTMDDGHVQWALWTGRRGDRPPHPLTQSELADALGDFHTSEGVPIRPKTVWPLGASRVQGSSKKGYVREQFEAAWRRYCRDGDGGDVHPFRPSLGRHTVT